MSTNLDKLFRLRAHGTSVRVEVLAGITTFVTMAYIIVVNPAILGFAGIPTGPGTVATILTAAFGSALMGFYANRPIAVAPYMGENAFIAFGLASLGIGWQQRLGSVFLAGILFLLITILGLRGRLARAISPSLKYSFAVGIGLFLALIGLYEIGIVRSSVAGTPAAALTDPVSGLLKSPPVPLAIGDLGSPETALGAAGFLLIALLMIRRVRGAIFIGIVVTAMAGAFLGQGRMPSRLAALPFTGDYTLAPIALHLDVLGVLRWSFFPVLLTLFLMSFLDTLGTLVGVGAAAGLLDEKGDLPEIEKPMTVDALSCIFSGLVGTSTSGAYIESAAGIREGARTGLAAVTTAALFAVCLFFIPLLEPLQSLKYAYAPPLVAVGLSMVALVTRIDFPDLSEAVPAFLTIVMMVFTYNIANGLTAGLITWPLAKLAAGRAREISPGSIVLALLCLAYYVLGKPH